MQPGATAHDESGAFLLTWTTIRRTFTVGRIYLALGVILALFLSLVLLLGTRGHGGTAFLTAFPLELPLFATLGSTGGLMTFTSDRTKGVFEYLIAYGIRPRRLFANGLIATAAMSTIILALSLSVGLGAALAEKVPLNEDLFKALGLYTVPMGFAGGLLVSTVGMIWSSISTPRTGINSPVGIAPMIGIAPVILVLIVAESAPASEYYYITGGAAVAIIAAVVALLAISGQLMGRERFLSPL